MEWQPQQHETTRLLLPERHQGQRELILLHSPDAALVFVDTESGRSDNDRRSMTILSSVEKEKKTRSDKQLSGCVLAQGLGAVKSDTTSRKRPENTTAEEGRFIHPHSQGLSMGS